MRLSLLVLAACLLTVPPALAADPNTLASIPTCEDEQQYYAIFVQGQKSGHALTMLDCRPQDDQVITSLEVKFVLQRAGQPLEISITSRSRETLDGKPLGFASDQNLGAMLIAIRGKRLPDDTFRIVSSLGAFQQEQIVPWPQDALLPWGADLAMRRHGLQPGASYQINIFDPTVAQAMATHITVGEKEKIDLLGRLVEATRLTTRVPSVLGDTAMTSWCDDQGNILRDSMSIMDMEIEMIACDKEFALADLAPAELIDRILLASPCPLTGIRDAHGATYKLAPRPGHEISLASCDNQSVEPGEDGALIVTVSPVQAPAGIPFPYTGEDPQALAALKPSRYLQCDHPGIIALARQAVGDAPDAAQAAARIEQFVGRYITSKNFDIGYGSAAEILQTRTGDCSEHAVLSASMLRAVGIPARVVVGYVYVDEFEGNEHVFGGHAWTEAYLAGQWIGLDATRCRACRKEPSPDEQPPLHPSGYHPGHLRLTAGLGEPLDFTALFDIDRRFTIAQVTTIPGQ